MRWLALLTAFAVLHPIQAGTRASAQDAPAAPAQAPGVAVDAPLSFDEWLAALTDEARGKGFSDGLIEETLAGLQPLERVIQSDRSQAELNPGFSRYAGARLTPVMINRGKELLVHHKTLLARAEKEFGIQPRFLVAFWGIESRYGRMQGSTPVFQALATLAWEPRRATYFRAELYNALTMVQRRHIEAATMTGSWAGAMGQTQFMPSSYLRFAVDFDGDDRRDIWKSTPDTLASMANYLKGFGWKNDETWGREVTISDDAQAAIANDPEANRRLLCDAQHERAASARRVAKARRAQDRRRGPSRGGHRGRARGRRRAQVPRLLQLRRDHRLQLRALLRAHGRPAG